MKIKKITQVGKKIGLTNKDLYLYGNYKAKIVSSLDSQNLGEVVLVSAITPTKYGEGKTTTAISLVDSLNYLNKKAILNLREPSLGPYFGLKGGATGGGKNSIQPDEDINLHFNGDFHAITSANNLIASCIDNTIYWGNSLDLDPSTIKFKRCIDMNDRSLRDFNYKIKKDGQEVENGFVITAASELMAIFCLAKDEDDFISRVNDIIIGYTYSKKEVYVKDLHISNAIRKLIRQALYPNLVQTGYNNPCVIHGGPFANIACGCNSLISLNQSRKLGDIVVTEAGFGADLGGEKFLDIISQLSNLKPKLAVLVVTIRALKYHGGETQDNLKQEDLTALEKGIPNMIKHVSNLKKFGIDVIININKTPFDTKKEIDFLVNKCEELNLMYAINSSYQVGQKGGVELARKVIDYLENHKQSNYHPLYTKQQDVKEKIEIICKQIYGAKNVIYSLQAEQDIKDIKENHHDKYYVCIAKTPSSFSDDAKLINDPKDFDIHINRVNLANGAKLIIPITNSVMLLPGLGKVPNAVLMEKEEK